MKVLSLTAAMALLANKAAAHYIWTTLDIAGSSGTGAEGGIRPNTNNNSPVTGESFMQKFSRKTANNCIDLASNDLRCNEGGLDGSGTAVRDITAGSDFTFHTDVVCHIRQ